jgi:hypothetical protein
MKHPTPTEPGWYWYETFFAHIVCPCEVTVNVHGDLWMEAHGAEVRMRGLVDTANGTWGPRIPEWIPDE